jgi:hypothetical protein
MCPPQRLNHIFWCEDAAGSGERPHRNPAESRRSTAFVQNDVRMPVEQNEITGLRMGPNRDLVRHAPRRHKHG